MNKPRKKQLAWKVATLEAELRRLRALVDITAPREGCCIICGQPLDDTAQEAHDARCSTCYRVVFDRRREAATGEAS